MSNNILLFAGIFLAIVVGGYMLLGSTPNSSTNLNNVASNTSNSSESLQQVYIHALGTGGYDNPQVTVKKGIPVQLHFRADPNTGCGRALFLDGFNVQLVSQNGEDEVAQFTPSQAGTYSYHCGMNMYRGQMVVQ